MDHLSFPPAPRGAWLFSGEPWQEHPAWLVPVSQLAEDGQGNDNDHCLAKKPSKGGKKDGNRGGWELKKELLFSVCL